MKVLIEEADEPNGLFFNKYSGIVLAETNDRYLVRHHFIFRTWIPKSNPLIRCVEIHNSAGKETLNKEE